MDNSGTFLSFSSLRLFGGSPSERAHPDRGSLTETIGQARIGQDAPNFRLRDIVGALALLAMLYGMLLFPEVAL